MASFTGRVPAVLATLATAISLSCCSSPASDNRAPPAQTDKPVVTGKPAGYDADDVNFANQMIPHHKQGIDMSALVPHRSTNPTVVAFAAKSASVLQSDMAILRVLRVQWEENPDSNIPGGGPGATMKGLVDDATIAKLESLHGTEFDTLWLRSRISFDQGAIDMANAEIANGKNADAIGLAQQIVGAQQAEIGQIKQMLGG